VCTYTQDKHDDNIVSGVLGEGGSKAPSPPARESGGALSSKRGVLPPALSVCAALGAFALTADLIPGRRSTFG